MEFHSINNNAIKISCICFKFGKYYIDWIGLVGLKIPTNIKKGKRISPKPQHNPLARGDNLIWNNPADDFVGAVELE